MEHSVSLPSDFLPVLLQLGVALGFVCVMMFVSHFIGGKRKRIRTVNKQENFECGNENTGDARFPFSVKYFLIAILFVLFDVEVIFFYPWSVNFKELGWAGLWEMFLFVSFFLAGFYYILKKGALNWNK